MKELDNELNDFLNEEEKVLWKGQSKTNVHLTALDLFYVPASVLFILFAIKDFIIDEVDLMGIPFIIFGLYILVGRFFMKYFRKRRILYYVTSKRVIVLDKSRNKILLEKNINSIKHINKNIRRNGVGTLQFGNPTIIQLLGGNTGLDVFDKPSIYESGETRIPVFYDIQDSEYVYKLVNDVRKTS